MLTGCRLSEIQKLRWEHVDLETGDSSCPTPRPAPRSRIWATRPSRCGLLGGEGLPMIGKLLGHIQVQTTARYAHLANDLVKAAANRIAEISG